jgi:hypothetical protein
MVTKAPRDWFCGSDGVQDRRAAQDQNYDTGIIDNIGAIATLSVESKIIDVLSYPNF